MDHNTENVVIEFVRLPRPRGRPKKYVTEEERLEIKRANDRKYYNQNSEAKKEKVREYQTANKEYILQRKRDLYHKKNIWLINLKAIIQIS